MDIFRCCWKVRAELFRSTSLMPTFHQLINSAASCRLPPLGTSSVPWLPGFFWWFVRPDDQQLEVGWGWLRLLEVGWGWLRLLEVGWGWLRLRHIHQPQGLDFKDNRPKDIADLFHDPCKKTIEDSTAGSHSEISEFQLQGEGRKSHLWCPLII